MYLSALSFLAGILSLHLTAELPGAPLYLACLSAFLLSVLMRNSAFRRLRRLLTLFLFGMCWAQIHATQYLQHILPERLAGEDRIVTVRVRDIPARDETVQRFIADVVACRADACTGPFPKRLKLSWYYGEPVRAGETWQFTVRLKPPHGFMNPGGFDYEAWLYQQGIHATGYVRSGQTSRRLGAAALSHSTALRQGIADRIGSVLQSSAFAGLVGALAVGDRGGIDAEQWQVLINTGTNHLIAISGLHIGLAAAFGYTLCRRLVPARLMQRVPAQHLALVCAVLVASVYAMLAGFAIPTQRALLMLICVVVAALLRRASRPMDVLAMALILVLLWDPVSVMSAGFWFSFLAVAVIFYTVSGTARSRWWRWLWLQVVIAVALLPMSLFMFQRASLVSPLANVFMVPYVSLLIVPLVLLSMLLMPFASTVAGLLLMLAAWLFEFIWPLLQWLSEAPFSHWTQASPGLVRLMLAFAGLAILLAPRIRHWRFAGIMLVLPMLMVQRGTPAGGGYALHLLDVGQGLAVVVRTASHTLVYDTGARFSERLDSGEAVIVPFLRYQAIGKLDMLMISHGDGDHIGGAASLLDAYPGTPVLGQGIEGLEAAASAPCAAGQQWVWDGVRFSVMHPDAQSYPTRNNRSCVLKIEGRGGTTLIAGDIENKVEKRLIRDHAAALPADILIAPHHGSKTSSSQAFIQAVAPQTVVFAAGYRNRYGFPAASVVARYQALGIDMHVVGHQGAISVNVDPRSGVGTIESQRTAGRRYWHHRPPGLRQEG